MKTAKHVADFSIELRSTNDMEITVTSPLWEKAQVFIMPISLERSLIQPAVHAMFLILFPLLDNALIRIKV